MHEQTTQAIASLQAARDSVGKQLMLDPLYRALIAIDESIRALSGVAAGGRETAPEPRLVASLAETARSQREEKEIFHAAPARMFTAARSVVTPNDPVAAHKPVGGIIDTAEAWSLAQWAQGDQGGECRLSAIRQNR